MKTRSIFQVVLISFILKMSKRKLEEFKDNSEFRYWGIVISRFVWQKTRSEVATTFSCSEPYVTKVMTIRKMAGTLIIDNLREPTILKQSPQ